MDTLERRFNCDFTELYGDWREWRGMRASNLYFLSIKPATPSLLQSTFISCDE